MALPLARLRPWRQLASTLSGVGLGPAIATTALAAIDALRPTTVVPGHYLANPDGTPPRGTAGVTFTRGYLQAFEEEAARPGDSARLAAAMKARYPQLGDDSSLVLGAKVVKGELKWPQ